MEDGPVFEGGRPMPPRDSMEVDVLFVGAGPAGLAGAIRLNRLAKSAGRELSIAVIEKGAEVGHHGISGAILNPLVLDELLPDWRERDAPLDARVSSEGLWFLLPTQRLAAPLTPSALDNRGHYVVSLQRLVKWLGAIAEAEGVDVFPAFPGQKLLMEGERVAGVRIGDKGVARDGLFKENMEPGPDLLAKITILGEGPRGTLTKAAIATLGLAQDRDPQVYALGIKELWQCRRRSVKAGAVIHTLNWPLPPDVFGGGFIYGMRDDILDVGLVVGLDYHDPQTDPHALFQRFKTHPAIASMLEGGTLLRYGAKAIPEGGLFAMPRLYAPGLMLIGDSAGFVDGMRLKGIHLAMKSGMLAAETAFDVLVNGGAIEQYERRFRDSWAYRHLYASRNFHQGFSRGLYAGLLNAGLGMLTGGRGFGLHEHLPGHEGYAQMRRLEPGMPAPPQPALRPDDVLTFSKVSDVFHSGTRHDEDQPPHLHVADVEICAQRCTVEYGNPCRHFCPANVYEPLFTRNGAEERFEGRLQLNFTNCVHCKTCDIMDPYQIITWVPPEGGGGPVYTGL